jgi:endonuclease/exonuclease/phosphatase family metal-dependent hydrolase
MADTHNASVLKIATYNLQFSHNIDDLVKNIKKMAHNGVVVFCFQEFVRKVGGNSVPKRMQEALGEEWNLIAHLGTDTSRHGMGTSILWKKDILAFEKSENMLLPKRKKLAFHEWLFTRLAGGKGKPFIRRPVSVSFHFDNHRIRITNIHLDNIGGRNHRKRQLEYVLRKLKTKTLYDAEIIAGDFNSFDLLKTGQERKMLQKLLSNGFIDSSQTINWTADLYNTDTPVKIPIMKFVITIFRIHIRRKLDYIWVKNFKVVTCKKLEVKGSDHYPIIASLKLER